MTKHGITVGFAVSFLLLALAIFVTRNQKQPSIPNADIQQTELNASIPPGFWIEYDPVEQRYTHCHDSYGVSSCWVSFHTREDAISDAQFFANYLKERAKD
jgi:hypothetical protein